MRQLLSLLAPAVPLVFSWIGATNGFTFVTMTTTAPLDSVAKFKRSFRSTTTSLLAASSLSSSAPPLLEWLASESLESLLPKQDALAILQETLSNEALLRDSEALVTSNWESLERRFLEESRPLTKIMGQETTDRVVKAVANLDEYDDGAVRAFLGSDAINKLFAKILYDGIFEFFQRIDVFGNVIGGLPIIGPVRKQIVSETKKQLDRTLGPLVQGFLGTYTKVAVLEATDFVVSPTNRKAFGSANVKLVLSLLERPANSLYPGSEITSKLKDEVFAYLRNVDIEELDGYLTILYDLIGGKSVGKVVNVDQILSTSPTLRRTIDGLWDRALKASRNQLPTSNNDDEI